MTALKGDIRANNIPAAITELVIDVVGTPAPQGSKSFKGMRGGHPILAESSKKVGPWRDRVEVAARARMRLTGAEMFTVPLIGEVWFWLKAPAKMPPDRIVDGVAYPSSYPDASKLVRSTEDALKTAGVVADDALFCDWIIHKRYAQATTGARIVIRPIGDVRSVSASIDPAGPTQQLELGATS